MPTIIDYSSFVTPTGSWLTQPEQPYEYAAIKSDIGDLPLNDGVVIFTNLPDGMVVALPPATTEPFDSVYIDLEGYNDYVYMKSAGNATWTGESNILTASFTSGNFWLLGNTGNDSPGTILKGNGNPSTLITDIQWEPFEQVSNAPVLEPGGNIYNMNATTPSINLARFDSIFFAPWSKVFIQNGIAPDNNLVVSGKAPNGIVDQVTLANNFTGSVEWSGNSLISVSRNYVSFQSDLPAPFSGNSMWSPDAGISWNETIANEIYSNYTVLTGNEGGTGAIQISDALAGTITEFDSFNGMPRPLRNIYVVFNKP